MIRIIKRKATGFFKKEDIPTIRKAIQDCHAIISEASVLLRAYYLRENRVLAIDKDLVGMACKVVQGLAKAPTRKKKAEEKTSQKQTVFQGLLNVYRDLHGPEPPAYSSDLSLSHILAYSSVLIGCPKSKMKLL